MRSLSQNEGLTFWRKRKSQGSEIGISTFRTFPLLAFKTLSYITEQSGEPSGNPRLSN